MCCKLSKMLANIVSVLGELRASEFFAPRQIPFDQYLRFEEHKNYERKEEIFIINKFKFLA